MQNFTNVIKNALSHYDDSNEKYDKLLKYNRKLFYDNEKNTYIINFVNKNKEVVFSSKCEMIGKYDLLNGFWLWAWADNSYDQHIMQYSKKILSYGLNLDSSKLRDHFINSKIFINSNAQLDIHLALILYILKKHLIVPVPHVSIVDRVLMSEYNVNPVRLNSFVIPTEIENYDASIKRISVNEINEGEDNKKSEVTNNENDENDEKYDYDTDTEDN